MHFITCLLPLLDKASARSHASIAAIHHWSTVRLCQQYRRALQGGVDPVFDAMSSASTMAGARRTGPKVHQPMHIQSTVYCITGWRVRMCGHAASMHMKSLIWHFDQVL